MDEKKAFENSPIRSIFEKFSVKRDVTLVYGDPIKLEHRTILPVAKVKYGVGAGSGAGDQDDNEAGKTEPQKSSGRGEGAGGSFSIKPVGVYDITEEKTTYKPIVPVEMILMIPVIVTVLTLIISALSSED
ncbi:GerW family sporulation protein [Alkalicoccus saliphilus]|uniref:GerW family sporulation protein n=1 Tax=Alkalicoccus saliphilus TaxID=200989 RepID=UPI00135CF72B|nr:spore germination protein GerW family protein [Alkalicoccus saliphilus]